MDITLVIAIGTAIVTAISTHLIPKIIEFFKEKAAARLAKTKQDAEISQNDSKVAVEMYRGLFVDMKNQLDYVNGALMKGDEERAHLRAEIANKDATIAKLSEELKTERLKNQIDKPQ